MRFSVYLAGLIAALAAAFPAYLNSSFLAGFVGEKYVGLIYMIGTVVTLALMPFMPKLLRQRSAAFWLALASLLGLITTLVLSQLEITQINLAVSAFVIYYLSIIFSAFCLDLILETLSKNKITGQIRGIYWTVVNLAWLASPFLASRLVIGTNLAAPYQVASLMYGFLLIFSLVWISKRQSLPSENEKKINIWQTLRNKNIRLILGVELVLNIFYSLMVIYMPVYLNQQLNMSWAEIGIIFTFMLIPFVTLEYPLGRLADKYWGEKEILITGIIVMALATGTTSFITSTSVLVWSIALFLTRVGAASIEIMKEAYLFKKINAEDVPTLALSRNMAPLGHLIGPGLAMISLFILPYQYLFLVLAILILIFGLIPTLALRDTK